jgi:hypothetical protein
MSKYEVMSQFWRFMRVHKKLWMAPLIILLMLFGILFVLAKSSAVAPFIYTLF